MKANVQNVALRGAQRIIAISDVHGNGHLLQRLLEQIGFSAKDALVLLGDHIEKGCGSLYTLRFIKSLCEAGNAYALQGNCDTLWEDLKSGLYGVDLVRYMDWRKQSLLCDMCAELGLDVHARLRKSAFGWRRRMAIYLHGLPDCRTLLKVKILSLFMQGWMRATCTLRMPNAVFAVTTFCMKPPYLKNS